MCLTLLSINAKSKTKYVDCKNYDYCCDSDLNAGLKNVKKMAKKLGLKTKKSKKYQSFYAKGKKIKIGYNKNPNGISRPLYKIVNAGNKRFTYHGVRIGMTKKKCRSLLSLSPEKTKNTDTFRYVHGLSLTLYYNSKGKLKKWTYYDGLGPD